MINIEKIKNDANLDQKSKDFAVALLTEVNEMHEKAIKGLVTETALGEKLAEVKKSIETIDVKSVQEQVDNITKSLADIKNQNISENTKSLAMEIKEKLTAEIENLKGMAKTSRSEKAISLQLKSFLESDNASITTGSLLPTPQFEMGVSKAPDRQPYLLSLISTGIANSLSIYWTQRKTRTDNEGWVTEGTVTKVGGGSVTQSVLGYETKNAVMQNLLAFIKVSNNSIDDIDWLLSEIQGELFTLMALKLDADILNGTIAANGFDGLLTKATAFSAGGDTLAAGVTPNKFDALVFALNQVSIANHIPNYIVLHPSDVRDMKLTRDDQGAYLLPPTMAVGSNVSVDGVRIIANTGMTKGSYLVGDFSKAKFWFRKGMELKIHDQNEDDAINMLKTITLYMRGTLVVKDADTTAFVTDTFADTITEITKVGA